MEHIRQAVELKKATKGQAEPAPERLLPLAHLAAAPASSVEVRQVELNRAHLEFKRIIAHDVSDLRSRSYDVLRTELLQAMDKRAWRFLAVTSPTPGCGKTVTAVNLALSIARQSQRSVVLVDLDLQKPNVAATLGAACDDRGLLRVIAGEMSLQEATFEAHIGKSQLVVLPTETAIQHSSALLSSRAMVTTLDDIKKRYASSIVIFDLPPILAGDDVITILPQMDCTLFVTAVGTSTISEIKECNKHLESTEVIRVVVNKSPDTPASYYY